MQLVGVDAVGHRHARNRGSGLPAGFNGALLEFETVGPSGGHIVSAKIKRTPTSVRLTKRLRFSTSVQDGVPRTLTIDVIFIHRDADNAGIRAREQEISAAAQGVVEMDRIIPVIPVTMLETWLLADSEAIKRVAGNSGYKGNLDCIPAIRQMENIPNAKQLLLDALCEASQTQGTRLRKFKKRFPEMRARLTFDLDPNGPVRQLDS